MKLIVEGIACVRDRVEPMGAGGAGDRSAANGDGGVCGRRPDVGRQVRMRVIDTGVDDSNDDLSSADRFAAGIRRIDLGPRGARYPTNALADVEQIAEIG